MMRHREGRYFAPAFLMTLMALALLTHLPGSVDAESPVIDGEIGAGEYNYTVTLGDGHYKLHWTIEGDTVLFGIEAKVSGFVALGIKPEKRMLHADMYIGWRDDTGTFELHDAWSKGETGPHPDDVTEGGTFDILEYTANETGGWTVIEFSRKLVTGDRYDKNIPTEGKVKFIWATSDEDEFDVYHGRRGTAIIEIDTGELEAVEYPPLWPYHAIFMSVGLMLLVTAFFCVVYKRKLRKRYVNVHHSLASAGVVCAIIGTVIGFIMVGRLDQGHFRVLHAILGGTDIVLLIGAPSIAQTFLMGKPNTWRHRKPHMYMGGTAILLMVITVIAGLVYVFP
jgi:hypothetical protein